MSLGDDLNSVLAHCWIALVENGFGGLFVTFLGFEQSKVWLNPTLNSKNSSAELLKVNGVFNVNGKLL